MKKEAIEEAVDAMLAEALSHHDVTSEASKAELPDFSEIEKVRTQITELEEAFFLRGELEKPRYLSLRNKLGTKLEELAAVSVSVLATVDIANIEEQLANADAKWKNALCSEVFQEIVVLPAKRQGEPFTIARLAPVAKDYV